MKAFTASPLALAVVAGLSATSAARAADESTQQLAEVVVTDSRESFRDILSPGVVSVAYPDDVKGEHKSIPDLLDQIPGVYVRRLGGNGHYTTATIRGSEPSQVNIYIDGVPLNTASESAADLSTLPIANVERVEVYRGTTPARFSGAPIGGAINIVTKKPKSFSGSISGGARSFDGEQYSASLNVPVLGGNLLIGLDKDRSTGDFKYTDYGVQSWQNWPFSHPKQYSGLSATYWTETGTPAGRPQSEKRTRMNNSSDKENVLLKWEDRRFVVKYARTEMERYLPKGIATAKSGPTAHLQDLPWLAAVYNPRNRQQIRQQEVLAGWRDSFGKLDLGLNLSWLDKDQQYRNLDIAPPASGWMGRDWTEYRTERKGIAGDATYTFATGPLAHQLEVHAERYWEVLDSDMSGNNGKSEFIEEFKRTKTNLQIQDTLTIAALGDLQVTPIFRVEKLAGPVIGSRYSPLAGPQGDYNWDRTGSLSVKKNFTSGWQAFANYGTYVRYPNFYEIYGNGLGTVPNVDSTGRAIQLVPESGRNSDLGFGWSGRVGDDWRGDFRLTWFQRYAENAITLYSTPFAAKYINSGNTRTRGLELEGKLAWGRRADLQLAVTRQEGKYVDKDGYYYFGGASASQRWPGQIVHTLNTPEVVANARLNLHLLGGDLTTFIEATYIGKVWRDVTTWENPLKTVGLGAHYRIAKGWKLSAGVNDIFDAGPKQTLGGDASEITASWRRCVANGRYVGQPGCNPFPLANLRYVTETVNLKSNVGYPQQGRTLYATLAYSF
jgi:outer membrane cobalamin receptor